MQLTYKSRSDQLIDSSIKFNAIKPDDDAVLDGVAIPRPMHAENWLQESKVHKTVLLSDDIRTTRNFVGPQTNIIRDDLRKVSHAIHIEGDNNELVLSKIKNSKIVKQQVISANVWRADMALNKFSGKVHLAYIKVIDGNYQLFINDKAVETQDSGIDFPFIGFSQLPIGHVPKGNPYFSMVTYKSRETGKVYFRKFDANGVGAERLLSSKPCVGGAPFAAIGNKVVFQMNLLQEGKYQPAVIQSRDAGETLSNIDVIDIAMAMDTSVKFEPQLATPIVDYSGMVHIPVNVTADGNARMLDVIVEDKTATEAIKFETSYFGGNVGVLAVFPKTVCTTRVNFDDGMLPERGDWRFGDGWTDGVGIIGVMLNNGELFSSNSQSGGATYPEKRHLNHEMLDILNFSATECYTKGKQPNIVSMDYMFLEAAEKVLPTSGELHLETWDMPLPIPYGKAELIDETTVTLTIENNANFLPGGTNVSMDIQVGKVAEVTLIDHRKASVNIEPINPLASLKGQEIKIECKNIFYHHELKLIIE